MIHGHEHWNRAVREALDGRAWEVRGALWQMAQLAAAYMHQADEAFPGLVDGKRLSECAEDYVPWGEEFDEALGYRQADLERRAVELENEVDRLRSVVASLEVQVGRCKTAQEART